MPIQELSDATKKLVSQYELAKKQDSSKEGSATIHVDEVAQKVAGFYEKIRTKHIKWKIYN